MGVDIMTLALAKAYADEVAAAGGNPEETKQYIDTKIKELIGGASIDADTLKELEDKINSLGKSSSADWSVNDETAAGHIKNRTHYDLGTTAIPSNNSDGTETYWTGPTGEEVLEQDYFIASELGDGYAYQYRQSTTPISLTNLKNISASDISINHNGTITTWEEYTAGEVEIEIQEVLTGKIYGIVADSIPLVVSLVEDVDLSEIGSSGVASKGTYFLYAPVSDEEIIFINRVVYNEIKQLDLKYIPESAFGEIDLIDYGTYATLTITDREGNIKSVTINDGSDGEPGAPGTTPVRGTDYWTEADKAEIKAYVDSAILGGTW